MNPEYVVLSAVQLLRIILEQYQRVQEGTLSNDEFMRRWGSSSTVWSSSVQRWKDAGK